MAKYEKLLAKKGLVSIFDRIRIEQGKQGNAFNF
jgi:hypothetical protein